MKSLKFELRKPNAIKSPLMIRFSCQDQAFKFYPGISVHVKYFVPNTGQVRSGHPDSEMINATLAKIKGHISEHLIYLKMEGRSFNPDQLKKELRELLGMTVTERRPFLWEYMTEEISSRAINPSFAHNTIKKYLSTMRKVKRYAWDKRVDQLDQHFIPGFISYLASIGNNQNTISKEVKVLKVFMRIAKEQRILPDSVSLTGKNTVVPERLFPKRYLRIDELEKIRTSKLLGSLDNTRRLFLILCYTGQRYGDLGQMMKSDILEMEGLYFAKLIQVKTGSVIHVPLHPIALELIRSKPKLISNQKMNGYIKEVCRLSGIDRPGEISTHTGRRTAATNLYLSGVSAKLICSLTGHKTESMLLRYIQADSLASAIALGKVWQ